MDNEELKRELKHTLDMHIDVINKYLEISEQYKRMLRIIKDLHDFYPQFLYEVTSKEEIIDIVKGDKDVDTQ